MSWWVWIDTVHSQLGSKYKIMFILLLNAQNELREVEPERSEVDR